MATLVKRGRGYAVVYYYTGDDGKQVQKWESFRSYDDAKKRKSEIEYQQARNDFTAPTPKTVSDLLFDFVNLYGTSKWSPRSYTAKIGLIQNYIVPYIGKFPLNKLDKRTLDDYYRNLGKRKSVKQRGKKEDIPQNISPRNILEIHKVIRCALNQAVEWGLIGKNPTTKAILPKIEKSQPRAIWDVDTFFRASQLCEDYALKIAMHLAFACTGREGEILGLTWDCVDISEISIAKDNASVRFEKQLARISKEAIAALNGREILFTFPALFPSNNTDLVLKEPKTETSVRRVWLPRSVAKMLVELKKHQDEMMDIFGDEYHDYNLVIALENGRPIESRILTKRFKHLIDQYGLPPVVFHSLRATSTTYKLKLNNGDVKATQGDTGHAQAKVLTDIYARILDEDRRLNAVKLEQEYYSKVHDVNSTPETSADRLASILKESPELVDQLLELLKGNEMTGRKNGMLI